MSKTGTATFEIAQAGLAELDLVVPLFDAYLQFYRLPSNEEAARRFLHARLRNGEAVIALATEESPVKKPARQALGFTLLYPTWSSLAQRRWWQLNDLYVV